MQRQREIFAVTLSLVLGFLIIQLTAPSCRGPEPGALATSEGPARPGGPAATSGGGTTGAATSGALSPGPDVARAVPWPSAADVVSRVMPSVVYVSSTRVLPADASELPDDPFFHPFHGGDPRGGQRRELSLGSGVIVAADGLVLTNNHVVEHAEEVEVTLSDGRTLAAKIVGTDPLSDLAVIRLKDPPKGLVPIEMGDSAKVRLGDFVLAIGNPFGVGETVTFGMVSAKGRADLGIVDYEDFIQTDAAINPGNSGGALVDLSGKLIGINTAILSRSGGYQGIGFAIPTEMARPIADELVKSGKVVRGWLGIGILDLTPELAEALTLGSQRGVLVSDVPVGTPGARAGLHVRDVIVEVDGVPVTSAGRLRNEVAKRGAGVGVDLLVLRDGATEKVRATLGELPAEEGAITRREPRRGRAPHPLPPLDPTAHRVR